MPRRSSEEPCTHLQLLHPVFTFGRLALLCLIGFAALPVSMSYYRTVTMHFSMTTPRSHSRLCYPSSGALFRFSRCFQAVSFALGLSSDETACYNEQTELVVMAR
jgi:hypothetical protein